MSDTFKTYLQRNLKAVIARFGDVALLDEIAKTDLSSALQAEIDAKAEASDLSALEGTVDTLVGSDTSKSVRTIANEELATQLIPENAQAALDTLQEIAAWIQAHPADASAMAAKLTLGTHEVGGETVQYATVKDYVEAYVAAQNGITLQDLSASATGSGNVITGLTYDNTTGQFTATKTFTAAQLADFSGSATGDGNVVTGFSYNNATGAFTATKGDTAIMIEDLADLTASEISYIFS